MPRPYYHIYLNAVEEQKIKDFLKEALLSKPPDLRARQRGQIILASHHGATIPQICREFSISERSVRTYLAAYRQHGLTGLKGKIKGRTLSRKSGPAFTLTSARATPKAFGESDRNILVTQSIMTLQETAAYLRVSIDTIYRLVRQGKLPAAKVGGQWRFRKEDIYNYLGQLIPKLRERVRPRVKQPFRHQRRK